MQIPHTQSSLEDQLQQQNGGQQQYPQDSENPQPDHDFLEQILSTFPNCSWPPSDPGMSLLPLRLGNGGDSVDASPFESSPAGAQGVEDAAVQALYNGFAAGSLHSNQQHFHPPPPQNFGGEAAAGAKQKPPGSASNGGSSSGAPQRQRVRARRGQATDPHSIAERLRRERIAERMKSLQELVPNANKTDKASMLDEIIDYVKFLQLQVKVLSMSRLGGAGAVSPLVADIASERGGVGRNSSSGNLAAKNNDNIAVTEHQVAKLMEDDMGTAMQYLQGKGLCLMPISLATAISTATCHSRNPFPPSIKPPINLHSNNNTFIPSENTVNNLSHPLLPSNGGEGGASSPNMSSLTVHSATVANPTEAALNPAKEE